MIRELGDYIADILTAAREVEEFTPLRRANVLRLPRGALCFLDMRPATCNIINRAGEATYAPFLQEQVNKLGSSGHS